MLNDKFCFYFIMLNDKSCLYFIMLNGKLCFTCYDGAPLWSPVLEKGVMLKVFPSQR